MCSIYSPILNHSNNILRVDFHLSCEQRYLMLTRQIFAYDMPYFAKIVVRADSFCLLGLLIFCHTGFRAPFRLPRQGQNDFPAFYVEHGSISSLLCTNTFDSQQRFWL
jgi:hypothetical protein